MQTCLCKIKSMALEVEIIERFLYIKLQSDCFTFISISFSVSCTIYSYLVEDHFDAIGILRTFAMHQMTLGAILMINFHKTAMAICYDKLRRILTFPLNDENSYRVTEELDSILEFRQNCHHSFSKFNEFFSPALYFYAIMNILGYYFIILIVVIKTLDWEFVGLTNDTSLIAISAIGIAVCCYACLVAQEFKGMVRWHEINFLTYTRNYLGGFHQIFHLSISIDEAEHRQYS